jgi:hypothetical protein
MKPVIGFGAAALVLAGLWSGLSVPGLAQSPLVQQQPPRVFRYAYVTPVSRRASLGAEICYVEPNGCRMELVTVQNVEIPSTLGAIDTAATRSRAMVKACGDLVKAVGK